MESDVELAIEHALNVTVTRGRALLAVALRGEGNAVAVLRHAEAILARLRVHGVEVRFEGAAGRVRVSSVELASGSAP